MLAQRTPYDTIGDYPWWPIMVLLAAAVLAAAVGFGVLWKCRGCPRVFAFGLGVLGLGGLAVCALMIVARLVWPGYPAD